MTDQMRKERFVADVVDALPHRMPGLEQIVAELRGNIDERVGAGMSVGDALKQLGSPRELAERYAAALPLVASPLGHRLAAKLVDQGMYVALLILGVFGVLSAPEYFLVVLAAMAMAMLALSIYLVAAERVWGQTLGKRWFSLEVVSETGLRITWVEAIIRHLPVMLQIWPVDAAFVFFNDERQRAFEMVSKTRVVVARPASVGERPIAASRIATV